LIGIIGYYVLTKSGKKLINLIEHLGYTFVNNDLLMLALTHSSYDRNINNQRLEFLGDAILNFVVAEYLYEQAKNSDEGDLTRARSNLVKEETLALIAKNYSIQKCVTLGAGELKTGGCNKNSILADTMEAIIAAIYLDSNLPTIKKLIINWYHSINYLQCVENNNFLISESLHVSKDAKTILQELLHSKGFALPIYKIIKVTGKPHNQIFTVSCVVSGVDEMVYGTGTNRKKAEQDAAEQILRLL